jgi:hypothetical protein
MTKNCKHCIIDFKNKIIRTYGDNVDFTYNPVKNKYLMDVTLEHNGDGIRILGQQVFYCYAKEPIKLSDINGEVSKKYIKKSGTSKLEKWLGCEEYEYVLGEYYVKYHNDVTIFNIPKNIIDMFIFEHRDNKESQE